MDLCANGYFSLGPLKGIGYKGKLRLLSYDKRGLNFGFYSENLEVHKYLARDPSNVENLFFTSVRRGDFDSVKSLYKNGAVVRPVLEVSDLNILKFLDENKAPLDKPGILFNAAQNGNLLIVRYLVKDGVKTADVMDDAIFTAFNNKEVDIVKYLIAFEGGNTLRRLEGALDAGEEERSIDEDSRRDEDEEEDEDEDHDYEELEEWSYLYLPFYKLSNYDKREKAHKFLRSLYISDLVKKA